MNKVFLTGRLTKDPESWESFVKFTLAVDKQTKKEDKQTADFIDCVAFHKQKELVENYLHKGSKILVEGKLNTRKYTNMDEKTVYVTNVAVDRIEFLESKKVETATVTPVPQAHDFAVVNEQTELPFN